MGILKKVLLFLLGLIILMAIATIFLPSKSHVERSVTINAPASAVYSQVANLKNWEKWSPWKKADPGMKLSYSANPVGKGAHYSWIGTNDQSGKGKMTILDAVPNQSLKTQLDFDGMGTSYGTWKFEPTSNGTKVTWGFDSEFSGPSKWFGIMMDNMLGGQFEEGLAGIKQLAESMPAQLPIQDAPTEVPISTN